MPGGRGVCTREASSREKERERGSGDEERDVCLIPQRSHLRGRSRDVGDGGDDDEDDDERDGTTAPRTIERQLRAPRGDGQPSRPLVTIVSWANGYRGCVAVSSGTIDCVGVAAAVGGAPRSAIVASAAT